MDDYLKEKFLSFVSILIPCRNEEENIKVTIEGIEKEFDPRFPDYEVLVVNDGSTDQTENVVTQIASRNSRVRLVNNLPPHGIGNAIRQGLEEYRGQYVIIAMADASDDPKAMIRYLEEVKKGFDCCFGTRWNRNAKVEGYPKIKLVLNRMANWFISIFFGISYRDVTNAFKCYSRQTIDGIKPILSHHFNVTVELPLKAIVRGYSYTVIPTNWTLRKFGDSNLKIDEMGSRYLFIIMYLFFEKLLSRGDYRKK